MAPAILIEDTRNKVGKHNNVQAYCERHGIELVRQCLDVGDYMVPGGHIAVDTKRNLDETAHNLLNRNDRSRFWREVRRSREQGIKLYVLTEHSPNIKSIEDVKKWNSKYSKITGKAVAKEIYRVHISYGVEFIFCSKQQTAKKIIEILSQEEPNAR